MYINGAIVLKHLKMGDIVFTNPLKGYKIFVDKILG